MGLDAFADAELDAARRGRAHFTTGNQLLGLARTGGIAGEVLAELGATEAAIARLVDQTSLADEIETEAGAKRALMRPSPAAERALGRAEGIALGLGIKESPVHLLLALAYDRSGVHASVLQALGVERGGIVDALRNRGLGVPRDAPPPNAASKTDALILPDDQARVVVDALVRLSVTDRAAFFDPEGDGRWAYGSLDGRPGETRIAAEPVVGLRTIAVEALESAGFPAPPDDAWESAKTGEPFETTDRG